MIIVEPCYGLGNTMFQYAFLCELRKRGNRACFIIHKRLEMEHNGYELNKIFNIAPYSSLKWYEIVIIHILEFMANHTFVLYNKIIKRFFTIVKVKENFIFYPEVFNYQKNCLYFGTWQSLKYFQNVQTELKATFTFNITQLNSFTKETLKKLNTSNSIAIHIRRGDYTKEEFNGGFSKCCPIQYYRNAINIIKERVNTPRFYIFTNDIEYAKKEFKTSEYTIIEGNKNKDAWQDMFLMSQCKHNIIANSTFSWWAAYLNKNENKIIIAPKKWWYYFEKDDVVPDTWIRI